MRTYIITRTYQKTYTYISYVCMCVHIHRYNMYNMTQSQAFPESAASQPFSLRLQAPDL